jgi:hypothetical protein
MIHSASYHSTLSVLATDRVIKNNPQAIASKYANFYATIYHYNAYMCLSRINLTHFIHSFYTYMTIYYKVFIIIVTTLFVCLLTYWH